MLLDYTITKAGQVGFVRALSNQLLSKGIRVNAVCPGPVWTPLQPAAMNEEQMKEWHSSPAPIGRVGQPGELGPAYVFLASQDGSFISGQVRLFCTRRLDRYSRSVLMSCDVSEYPRQRRDDCQRVNDQSSESRARRRGNEKPRRTWRSHDFFPE